MNQITLKRGDTGIGLRATLSNEAGNVDLTDANVLFFMGKHEIKAGIHDAEGGVVNVTFNRNHTSKTGIFRAEFEVTYSDGRVEAYPNDDYVQIRIMKDLGGN
ncbi:hypothetical protein J2Z83_003722 [Virgibacillus natechei]|uniref:BppU N-terminal domain-containing protein n=1 Tax=Virgibacillus natechei TaxID=1216297 RepID=A0ABS4IMP1_9BACI|nr:BppU family phage baseplate upper protein [Virgibacillus natechei]MBP1971571.1 hypothetical protein [Virgibacillus natechei]UZD13095.1 phage baseplate upper protein [Virgibacillus natechei]